MPRVIVSPSALNPSLVTARHFDGDLEAFVRREYPNVKEWKFTTDGSDHYAIGVPAAPVVAAFLAINWYAVAASFVLSFVAGKLIGKPKAPVNTSLDAASPTYSIGGLQNQARLGAAIPVIYGDVTILPDYAAQPYVEFVNNEQYLRAIFCIGQGTVDVQRMFIGETNSSALPDVASWKVFQPADHNSTFGVIEAQTGIRENVFSNSEVADQILEGPKAGTGPAVPADWHWVITGNRAPDVWVTFEGESSTLYEPGSPKYYRADELRAMSKPIIGSTQFYWDGTGSGTQKDDAYWLVTATDGPPPAGATNVITVADSAAADHTVIGPFEMCKFDQKGTVASVDLVFAGGLYEQNTSTGALQDRSVEVKFSFTPIDVLGNPTGAAIDKLHTFTAKTNQVQRHTLDFTLPLGRYRCLATRTTPAATATNISDQVTWTGLKFVLGGGGLREPAIGANYNPLPFGAPHADASHFSWTTSNLLGSSQSSVRWAGVVVASLPNETDTQVTVGDWVYHRGELKGPVFGGVGYSIFRTSVSQAKPVYGDVTLVAVSIKATNGISSEASGRVRFKCLRLLNTLDGTGLTHTRNPVDALIDILTAQYGGRRPMNAEELDLDEMRRSRTKWANHNGFNAVFDKVTTVWEAMSSALQPVAAVPLPQGSRISIAHDCVKDYRVALFSDENIVAGSMQIGYEFDKVGDPEATRVEYRTPEWFDPDFVTLPPNREDVDTINLFGCTSKVVAEQHAVLANNRRRLRRKSITFETELEGLLVTHGQRIGVTHSTPKWGHSAQVLNVSGRTLTLSVAPDWTLPDLSVLIRDTEGRPRQVRGVTRGANDFELVLPANPTFSIPTIAGGYEGAVVAIGTYNHEVTDWVVMSMEPSGEQRIKITAVEYHAAVYDGAMPHQLVDSSVAP